MSNSSLPSQSTIDATVKALQAHNIKVTLVANKSQALETIKTSIPANSKIMNGSSTTLNEIGFTDYLKTEKTTWKNLHEDLLKETDWVKQSNLRRHALVEADYFLSGINAITEDGLLVAADKTGSRVGAFPFAASKLVFVSGTNKIVADLSAAMARIRSVVFPQEDKRAQAAYGMGTGYGKWVIIESELSPDRTHLILINESLGF